MQTLLPALLSPLLCFTFKQRRGKLSQPLREDDRRLQIATFVQLGSASYI